MKHTEGIATPKHPVELLEGRRRDILQTTTIAHNLNFMAIMKQVEEYQIASNKS